MRMTKLFTLLLWSSQWRYNIADFVDSMRAVGNVPPRLCMKMHANVTLFVSKDVCWMSNYAASFFFSLLWRFQKYWWINAINALFWNINKISFKDRIGTAFAKLKNIYFLKFVVTLSVYNSKTLNLKHLVLKIVNFYYYIVVLLYKSIQSIELHLSVEKNFWENNNKKDV